MANVLADPLPEGVFPPDLAAIVRYSRASTLMQPITGELWRGLSDHFDTKQILDIVFIVGMDQMISRMHAAILTEVDEFTPRTGRAVLPGAVAAPPGERRGNGLTWISLPRAPVAGAAPRK